MATYVNGQPRVTSAEAAPSGTHNHQQPQDSASTIVRFETNIPVELALSPRQPDNPIKKSPYGYADQALYFLTGGRKTYLDLPVAAMLSKLALEPGEPFVVCKREKKNAQGRRWIEWEVERVQPEPVAPKPIAQPGPPPMHWEDIDQAPPAPIAKPAAKPAPMKIPYDIAFREILNFVTAGLADAHEQWSDQAKQDMISTLVIQAARDGILTIWNRGGQ